MKNVNSQSKHNLSINKNQLHVLTIYGHHEAKYRTISKKKLQYNAIKIARTSFQCCMMGTDGRNGNSEKGFYDFDSKNVLNR